MPLSDRTEDNPTIIALKRYGVVALVIAIAVLLCLFVPSLRHSPSTTTGVVAGAATETVGLPVA
jgi:hypothetical protein